MFSAEGDRNLRRARGQARQMWHRKVAPGMNVRGNKRNSAGVARASSQGCRSFFAYLAHMGCVFNHLAGASPHTPFHSPCLFSHCPPTLFLSPMPCRPQCEKGPAAGTAGQGGGQRERSGWRQEDVHAGDVEAEAAARSGEDTCAVVSLFVLSLGNAPARMLRSPVSLQCVARGA